MNSNNALREDDELMEEAWKELEAVKKELGLRQISCKQVLDLAKERGIHGKYYRRQKNGGDYCIVCDKLGVRRSSR